MRWDAVDKAEGHVPVVARVSQCSVAGDTFALSLVEGIQRVRIVAGLPAPSVQVTPLIKALQHVLPLLIGNLENSQQVRGRTDISIRLGGSLLSTMIAEDLQQKENTVCLDNYI